MSGEQPVPVVAVPLVGGELPSYLFIQCYVFNQF